MWAVDGTRTELGIVGLNQVSVIQTEDVNVSGGVQGIDFIYFVVPTLGIDRAHSQVSWLFLGEGGLVLGGQTSRNKGTPLGFKGCWGRDIVFMYSDLSTVKEVSKDEY